MSILASQDQVSSKSDNQTSPPLLNNHNHGGSSCATTTLLSSSPASSNQQPPTTTTHAAPHSSASSVSHNTSGSLALPAHHSGRCSKKVNQKSWRPRVEASSSTHQQQNGANSHHETGSSSAMDTPPSTRAQGSSSSKSSAASSARKSQGISGNHLLNFHYDPISRPQPRSRAPPPPARQPRRKPYNKDLFLQANYKFVVLDTGDYNPESMDPDKMLRWEDIVCFKFLSPFPVHCPICLGDPLCPQITSCGHIFCFPCIMQYFLIDQDDHKGECRKKCPLCFTMISSQDLYTIYIENVEQYSVGEAIEFVLLSRKKDLYTLSLKNNEGGNPHDQVLDYFSKFTLTSDVELSVRQAMSDLDSWLARADSGLVDDLEKLPYVCAAMDQLEKRKIFWNEHRILDANKVVKDINVAKELVKVSQSSKSSDKAPFFGKSLPDKINGKSHGVQTADVVELSEDHDGSSSSSYDDNTNTSTDGLRDSYSFYQAIDGQFIILHSINMKCLLHHYGTYDKLPNRIHGKILQLETVTQSETTRKRFRYLSHFSLTTTFQLCEIDLREVLPVDALSPFMDEIKNREKLRKRLARKERQEKIEAEAVGFGLDLVPVPYNVAHSSFDDSPTFSMDDFEALGSGNVTSSSPPAFGGRQLFSSVARLGFAAGHDSPGLKIEESQSIPHVDVSGALNTGTRSFASITSTAKPDEGPDKSKTNESGKKGRKPSRVLLSTAGGRRY